MFKTEGRTFSFILLCLLSCIFSLSSRAFAQVTTSSQREDERLYYEPKHFVWIRVENDRRKQDDLLPLLSHQHVVIILEQPDDMRHRRVRAFLENPPPAFPAIAAFQVLPPPRTDKTYAAGYIQEHDARVKAAREFATYLLTFQHKLRLAPLFRVLHELATTPDFDFVLPVFFLPDKMAAPFIQFEVDFLAPELVLGGIDQIKKTNRMNFVKETQQTNTLKNTVVLQLEKDAPTNILATVLRYQQMPWIVQSAQLQWLRLRMPVEIQARWELPIGINSFSLWEPMRYILSIERDHDVTLLPKAFTEGAVHAWLSDNTHLPAELLQVDRIDKTTRNLEDGRVLDEISFVVRISKTGTYLFAPYPIQATYDTLTTDQRRLKIFRGDHTTFLTIPGQLPRQLSQIPGQLLSFPKPEAPFWVAPSGMILGIVCMVVGLVWTLRISGWSLARTTSGVEESPEALTQNLEALTSKYRGRLREAQRLLESFTFTFTMQGDMAPERAWLRFLSICLKQLLAERCYQDESHLLGGLGVSSASIRRYMLATSVNPDQHPIAEALHVLHVLERQVLTQTLSLSKDEAKDLLARAEKITEEMFLLRT